MLGGGAGGWLRGRGVRHEGAWMHMDTGTPSHQLTVVEQWTKQPIRLKDPKSEREQNFETHYRSV